MGDVSLGIRDLGYFLLRHIVGDNTVAIFIDRNRCSFPDPRRVDLAGLVSTAGQRTQRCSRSPIKTTNISPDYNAEKRLACPIF